MKIAVANIPHRYGFKASKIRNVLNKHDRDIVFFCETDDRTRAWLNKLPAWAVPTNALNTRTKRLRLSTNIGLRLPFRPGGNKRKLATKVRQDKRIRVLKNPAMRVTRSFKRGSDEHFEAIGVHNIRTKIDSLGNLAQARQVAKECARLVASGQEVIAGGDWNAPPDRIADLMTEAGMHLLGREGVLHVWGSPGFVTELSWTVDKGWVGQVSDHGLLMINADLQPA